MNKQYQNYQAQIPLYLSGDMPEQERSELESFAAAHPEFAVEIEELRPLFATVASGFDAASNTNFKLSPARRAEILRDSGVNVLAFSNAPTANAKSFALPLLHKTVNWAAAAAAFLLVSFLGLENGRSQYPDSVPSVRLEIEVQIAELPVEYTEELQATSLVYGLDRPETWRFGSGPRPGALIRVALGGLADEVITTTDQPATRRYFELPPYFGLEGPKPYFDFDSLNDAEAI